MSNTGVRFLCGEMLFWRIENLTPEGLPTAWVLHLVRKVPGCQSEVRRGLGLAVGIGGKVEMPIWP